MLAKITHQDDIHWRKVNPLENEALRAINPLGKVPALQDDDLVLLESPLICEYLDDRHSQSTGNSLFMRNTADYYRIQQAHMMANGILDAAVAIVMERRRDDSEQSAQWLSRWGKAIDTALHALPLKYCGSADNPNIASIALAAALGYLDFRHSERNWRQLQPDLDAWFTDIEAAAWFRETLPETEL